MEQPPRIVHPDTLPSYSPPGHGGTVNRRLVEASLGAGLEMVLGEVAAGGAAHPHSHDTAWQIVMVIEGFLEHSEPGLPPQRCGPGRVIRIPPQCVRRARQHERETHTLTAVNDELPCSAR
jgi:quercetin dioxygenase-like cupin family protein